MASVDAWNASDRGLGRAGMAEQAGHAGLNHHFMVECDRLLVRSVRRGGAQEIHADRDQNQHDRDAQRIDAPVGLVELFQGLQGTDQHGVFLTQES